MSGSVHTHAWRQALIWRAYTPGLEKLATEIHTRGNKKTLGKQENLGETVSKICIMSRDCNL